MAETGLARTHEIINDWHATGRSGLWLVPVIYIVSVVAFILDLQRDNTLAYGIIYTPLVATAVFHRRRSGVWVLSGLACVLVISGAAFPTVDPDLPDMIGNRILSVLAILATAAFVRHARDIQERLVRETRRAEEAERIKSDLLSDLSEEIRTPLHTLLGVLTLAMADSKPGQRDSLSRIQADGRHLLSTIDNLIDLSQFDVRPLRQQTIDVASVARQAAACAGESALVRRVTVALKADTDPCTTSVIGDSWAVRRILDNLLANAVRLSPLGGTVSVSVDRSADMVTASVSDTGMDLPQPLAQEPWSDAPPEASAWQMTGGAGLELSNRLAGTMNGRVTARKHPELGVTVSLSLPAA